MLYVFISPSLMHSQTLLTKLKTLFIDSNARYTLNLGTSVLWVQYRSAIPYISSTKKTKKWTGTQFVAGSREQCSVPWL